MNDHHTSFAPGVRGTVLERILEKKQARLREAKRAVPLSRLEDQLERPPSARPFIDALIGSPHSPALIAELKKASPSRGLIREDFDPVELARIYEARGAACISVLTEQDFFQGSLEVLRQVRGTVRRPLLRKDFLFDFYQLVEARVYGADAVLLMASVLDPKRLTDLFLRAQDLELDALVEVHDERELDQALACGARLIGVNNRNLKTLEIDIENTFRLLSRVPEDRIVVTESGIVSRADVERFGGTRVRAMLVGTTIMKSPDVGGKIDELLGRKGDSACGPASARCRC